MNDPQNSASQPPTRDVTGRRLGDYLVLRRLGEGGMSDVYLAEQVTLQRKVAIKVLKPHLAADEKYLSRFYTEARAVASLVHANIVQIHEVACIDDVNFIAQEYVAGQNLKQLLSACGTLDVAAAANILRQVAAALHKAGSQGITHRDIKPENIMLTPLGEVKVADFGLARLQSDEEGVDVTQVGITMGTPLYMSPEQVEGQTIDPRSDLYSLGVTAYQMVTGRPPFEGDTALSVAVQHLKAEPEPLGNIRPELPDQFCRIVHKLLAKRPDDRYQRPSELLADLRQLNVTDDEQLTDTIANWSTAELLALADARPETTQQLSILMAKRASRNSSRWGVVVASLLLVGVAVGAGVAWKQRGDFFLAVDPTQSTSVDRMETVDEQYFYASIRDTEEAYRSVERFFPPQLSPVNERYAWLSRQHRAKLYLEGDRLAEAMEIYTDLAELGDAEIEFRAFGLAGQANVHMHRGQTQQAAAKLAQVAPLYERLERDLRRELQQTLTPDLRQLLQKYRRERPALDGKT